MEVVFILNQLRDYDREGAARLEKEIAEAVAGATVDGTLRCRIVQHGQPATGYSIRLDGPGWFDSFGISAPPAPGEVKLGVHRTLRERGAV